MALGVLSARQLHHVMKLNSCLHEDTDDINNRSLFWCLFPSIHASSDDWSETKQRKKSGGKVNVSSQEHTGLLRPASKTVTAQGAVMFDPYAFGEVPAESVHGRGESMLINYC